MVRFLISLAKMASSSRLTVDSVARYCTGEGLSDTELEAELDELEAESDEEGLESRISDDEEKDRVQNLLQGAYSRVSTSCPMPADRDSLLLLDPDISM